MRVGILCISQKENYGAKLLAWALQEKVRELLPEADAVGIIVNENHEEKRILDGVSKWKSPVALFQSGRRFAVEQKKKLVNRMAQALHNEALTATRKQRFDCFEQEYISILGFTDSPAEFQTLAETLDIIIVGSDIVFRPEYARLFPEVYFLGCLENTDKNIRKVAYAAAIATDKAELLQPLTGAYQAGINRFDFLSVREKSAQVFLQPLTEKEIVHCCDPVLLCRAEDFAFAPVISDEAYIYVNLLDKKKNAVQYVRRLAVEKNLPIRYFSDVNRFNEDNAEDVYSDGPLEFIDQVRNAAYVVTNSFQPPFSPSCFISRLWRF